VLWLIASHEGLRRGPPQSLANYARYRALRAALSQAYPSRRARSFGWAAVIHVVRFALLAPKSPIRAWCCLLRTSGPP
jgi:hypothetical protein